MLRVPLLPQAGQVNELKYVAGDGASVGVAHDIGRLDKAQYMVSARLFDHREDPREAYNLNDAKADLAAQFLGVVQDIYFSSDSVTPELSVVDDPEIREQLRAVGYLE